MKKRELFIILILCLCLALVLVGCAQSSQAEEESVVPSDEVSDVTGGDLDNEKNLPGGPEDSSDGEMERFRRPDGDFDSEGGRPERPDGFDGEGGRPQRPEGMNPPEGVDRGEWTRPDFPEGFDGEGNWPERPEGGMGGRMNRGEGQEGDTEGRRNWGERPEGMEGMTPPEDFRGGMGRFNDQGPGDTEESVDPSAES